MLGKDRYNDDLVLNDHAMRSFQGRWRIVLQVDTRISTFDAKVGRMSSGVEEGHWLLGVCITTCVAGGVSSDVSRTVRILVDGSGPRASTKAW